MTARATIRNTPVRRIPACAGTAREGGRRAFRPVALLACLLPALCGACSWVQALQDNFRMSFGNARTQPLALPVTEVQVRMVYPDGTNTVDRAVSYMLEPHSYLPSYRDSHAELIAQRSFIGNFDNEPVPMSVAMERLMGRNGQVVLDRDRKLYALRLRNPDEPGVAFADLGVETFAAAASPASWERLNQPLPAPDGNVAPSKGAALTFADPPPGTDFKSVPYPASADETPAADPPPGGAEDETRFAEDRDFCGSIQFRNRAMLSATVQKYFRECGFDEVSWRLGEPGRYADYRLLQDIDVPLPERHLDLIDLLQTRFGIRTLINEDNSVEFHDENSTL
ncbi:MAG: hypothetical protein OXG54_05635 [Gammaproteobacteria bacterium]|nr:hypothetical protein [Gammaproteobacteria bacterium]